MKISKMCREIVKNNSNLIRHHMDLHPIVTFFAQGRKRSKGFYIDTYLPFLFLHVNNFVIRIGKKIAISWPFVEIFELY